MHRPIGIFDSGVGGLTVAAAIKAVLPNESFIYYGDTRHAPYGDKSKSTISQYALRITKFLEQQDCKAIVIACNSASAAAYGQLKKAFPQLFILNVIDPVVERVAARDYKKVGVIATRATTKSAVYAKKIHRLQPNIEVVLKATPLLAPVVEEGFAQTEISYGLIKRYLNDSDFQDLNALILGCTHYPLLQQEIAAYYQNKVEIINSSTWVAQALKEVLAKRKLLKSTGKPKYTFYVSEKTKAFADVSQLFFGMKIKFTEKTLID
jgi:glutamate racemase